ncbi:flagellar hook-length control protein FliK [Erwinia phyllosphaerae]|uniref:flagellar hook-length control protein FliK n=1 Tax=Erwinia phyllosphaerae TaxID=2853256 RepID=UPI001FEDE001|nr:flagellar hook-length control protein FliK [Erwinia phyllosphaerae]MBV4366353.1 flagellar hook-length control protein FliK [Erwinia phyllosphaerae]
MITLPLVTNATNATKATSAATTTASATDATDIGTDSGIAATGTAAETGSAGFLTLLGNKLLTLAQQGQTAALPASTTAATAASTDDKDTSSPKAKLNALLAALDKPETLNALLQPTKAGTQSKDSELTDTSESSEGTAATATTTLSNNDMQALQALFAMLPQAQAQPAATATAAKGSDTLADGGIKGSNANATLASLLSNAKATTASADESVKGNDKNSQSGSSNVLTTSTAATAQKTDANTATLTSAFQQVLGQVSKDNDKENSSSATQSTITTNVISAASAAVTPAASSLVTAPAAPQLSSQLGSPEWQQALGQQIVMFSRNGQQTAELHLHPQDLGSIQISLKLDSDQAQLSMVSNHSQVRAALEAAMPQLKEALAQNGINLGQTNVSSDAFQQGQSFSGQQDQQRNNSRGNTFSLTTDNDDVTPIAVPASLQSRAAGNGAVDIFA